MPSVISFNIITSNIFYWDLPYLSHRFIHEKLQYLSYDGFCKIWKLYSQQRAVTSRLILPLILGLP